MLLLSLLSVSGCARPLAMREVALASQPIASSLQASGPTLQANLALQMRAFNERNDGLARQVTAFGEDARRLEREWQFSGTAGEKARGEKLRIIRVGDADVLRDPLAAVTAGTPTTTPANKVDLAGLDTAITGFSKLGARKKLDWQELMAFGKSVGEELRKINTEVSAAPADTAQP